MARIVFSTVTYLSMVGFAWGRNIDPRAEQPARMSMAENNIPSFLSNPGNSDQSDGSFFNLTSDLSEDKPYLQCGQTIGPPLNSCLDALAKIPDDSKYIRFGTRFSGLAPHDEVLPWYAHLLYFLWFSNLEAILLVTDTSTMSMSWYLVYGFQKDYANIGDAIGRFSVVSKAPNRTKIAK